MGGDTNISRMGQGSCRVFCIAKPSYFGLPQWRMITETRRAFRLWCPAKGQADYYSFCVQASITTLSCQGTGSVPPSWKTFRNLMLLRRSREAWRTGYLYDSCVLVLSFAAVSQIAVQRQPSARSSELSIFYLGEILSGVQHMDYSHLIMPLPLHKALV